MENKEQSEFDGGEKAAKLVELNKLKLDFQALLKEYDAIKNTRYDCSANEVKLFTNLKAMGIKPTSLKLRLQGEERGDHTNAVSYLYYSTESHQAAVEKWNEKYKFLTSEAIRLELIDQNLLNQCENCSLKDLKKNPVWSEVKEYTEQIEQNEEKIRTIEGRMARFEQGHTEKIDTLESVILVSLLTSMLVVPLLIALISLAISKLENRQYADYVGKHQNIKEGFIQSKDEAQSSLTSKQSSLEIKDYVSHVAQMRQSFFPKPKEENIPDPVDAGENPHPPTNPKV